MTKAPSPPPPALPAVQTTRGSSNEYDTPAETAAAAATTATTEARALPSTEDPQDEDECVLCCYPFHKEMSGRRYQTCCGEVICEGCIIAQQRTLIIGTNVMKPMKGSKEEEREFELICNSEQVMVCPFCRKPQGSNYKETLERLWDRIDDYKDPKAMRMLGGFYMKGEHGLSKNLKKAEKLFKQAYDLGDPTAAYTLAYLQDGRSHDQARMIKYLEEGARRGKSNCNNYLGYLAAKSGKHEEAKRQLMTAACAGHEEAMNTLMVNYRSPGSVVSKEDLATTLRTHQTARDEGTSEPREYAMRFKAFHKKMISTGKMKDFGNKNKRK